MTLERALAVLRENREALNARHVLRAAVFGSVARGDQRPDSDVDVLVELDPDATITIYDYVGIKHALQEMLGAPADVVNRETLHWCIRDDVEGEAVHAF